MTAPPEGYETGPCAGKRLRVPIKTAQFRAIPGFFQQSGGMSGKAESAVKITAARARSKSRDRFAQQNGRMGSVFR